MRLTKGIRSEGADRSTRRFPAWAVAGIATIAILTLIMQATTSKGSSPTIPQRPAEKSRAEVLAQLGHLPGLKEVVAPDIVAAGASDPSALGRHGAYRVVPINYAGELPRASVRQTPPKGVTSSDPTVLQSSPLYVAISVPGDMTRTEIDTYDGNSNTVIRQAFAGSDAHRRTLQVTRVARSDEPIDVYEQPKDSSGWLQLSTSFIAGHEAVILTPTAASPIPKDAQLVRIQFFNNGVETILTATGMDTAEVMAIADQIAKEGTR